ncbi:class I SAM-dependent methyltransferase [Aquabacterium sp. A7-Y]|uniref:class I SAM-dependent methyltransferase n=1 Tax=Aquabacterium sp. A7-Y TaxID=1349605 RepID=UPI00223D5165|nr:class I SAM-dependent methyltransferase [Aquabacterium sp. A7-Y]MCW7541744.1 class I SAM-dependent methyltransferase [Aquabacterium sp. A7-Y]
MTTTAQHYEHHLAPLYVWMAGGATAALQAGAAEIEAMKLPVAAGEVVVDLGAGFGMHAIPLARQGALVTAIDSSAALLQTLQELGSGLPVRVIIDDLLSFQDHVQQAPKAILCMGDTITHLAEPSMVDELITKAYETLVPGGVFVLSFRDYSVPLTEDQRFIPVRNDDTRLLTCFLDYETKTVLVHDIVHERTPQGWQLKVSHYRKLRLPPDDLVDRMKSTGFLVRREAGPRGMTRLIATKA